MWSFLFILFILFVIDEYPVISAAVALIVIGITLIYHNAEKRKTSEENKTTKDLAVKYIEEAYEITIKKPAIRPRHISLIITEGIADLIGFDVILSTEEEIVDDFTKEYLELVLGEYSELEWDVVVDDVYFAYIKKSWPFGVTGNRNQFKAEVWDTIKREHPSWNIISGRHGEDPYIRFD